MTSPDTSTPTTRGRGASRAGRVRSGAGLPALAAGLLLAGAAEAAVRECLAPVASAPSIGRDEAHARQLALADWIAKAARLGPGYTRWQIAVDRRIDCRNSPAGMLCLAVGRPCVIKQLPAPKARPKAREI